jgi:hypothetical protein
MKTSASVVLLVAGVFLSSISAHPQPPDFLWVTQAGGTDLDEGLGIATDGSNNVVATGALRGTATFGDSIFFSNGGEDVFIAKYDGDGQFLWATQAGGPNSEEGLGIAADDAGNSVVTGRFSSTAYFGDSTLESSGWYDIFIAKYDADGEFCWAAQAGGTEQDKANGIATDGSGNSIVTGFFFGTAVFGDSTLASGEYDDIFLAKYDADGGFLWAAQAGGAYYDGAYAIATDGEDNSIVTGFFNGPATFGDTTLSGAGSEDIFIAKYDDEGHCLWAAQAGGVDDEWGYGIATDGSGNSVVTGQFTGPATFGDTTLTSVGSYDVFVAKYDADGDFLWAAQAGGVDDDGGYGIATDGLGNSLVIGFFSGTATFGDTTLTCEGWFDTFIAAYDADGEFLWVVQVRGTDVDTETDIATDSAGNGLVTGSFYDTTHFGATSLVSTGSSDIFIAKLCLGGTGITGIEEEVVLPRSFHLAQNYPNPFSPATTIAFRIAPASGGESVDLKIYDICGREVRTLMNERKTPGSYAVVWDGRDGAGLEVSSGVYFCRLEAGGSVETRKMLLIR